MSGYRFESDMSGYRFESDMSGHRFESDMSGYRFINGKSLEITFQSFYKKLFKYFLYVITYNYLFTLLTTCLSSSVSVKYGTSNTGLPTKDVPNMVLLIQGYPRRMSLTRQPEM